MTGMNRLACRNSLFALAICVSAGAAGCKDPGDATGLGEGPVRPPKGSNYVFPATLYTGYDGQRSFKAPLATDMKDAVWEVEDPTILQVMSTNAPANYENFGEDWVLIETYKAGTTKVFATAGGTRAEATVIVSNYDRDIVTIGQNRYYDMNGIGDRLACAACHNQPQGADHSPLEMEFFEDADILLAITDGMYPDGYVLKGVDHRWNLTAEEAQGIVPYLRALAPKGFF